MGSSGLTGEKRNSDELGGSFPGEKTTPADERVSVRAGYLRDLISKVETLRIRRDELLTANTAEVERRRAAEAAVEALTKGSCYKTECLEREAALRAERDTLKGELEKLSRVAEVERKWEALKNQVKNWHDLYHEMKRERDTLAAQVRELEAEKEEIGKRLDVDRELTAKAFAMLQRRAETAEAALKPFGDYIAARHALFGRHSRHSYPDLRIDGDHGKIRALLRPEDWDAARKGGAE